MVLSAGLLFACGTDNEGGSSANTGGRSSSGGSAGAGTKTGGASATETGGAPEAGGGSGGTGGDNADAAAGNCTSNDDCIAQLGDTTPAGCATAKCSATTGQCVFAAADADGDGYKAAKCQAAGAAVETGDDCDDTDSATYPGAWDGPQVDGEHENQCNESDNDCNGTVDDGTHAGATCVCDPATDIDVPCDEKPDGTAIEWPDGKVQGSCHRGKKTCIDGSWGKCEGAVLPADKDSCEPGDDSTCDGKKNVGCTCKNGEMRNCGIDVGSCKHGTQTCTNGEWSTSCVGEIAAKPQDTCDATNDDNCNGQVHDNPACKCVNGETKTCAEVFGSKGACAGGKVACVGGTWPSACPVQPSKELCNKDGVDEDCDGNDKNSCSCLNGDTQIGCGACNNGYRTCSNGTYDNSGCSGGTSPLTYYRDADNDKYCDRASSISSCATTAPTGYLAASCPADCRDSNGAIPSPTNRCNEYYLGATSTHACSTFGGGCGVSNEWQIDSGEAPGACPAGFHPKCSARWISGNSGTQCWLAGEDYSGTNWSCRLHPSSAGFDGVSCAIDIECYPN
jgi:hypothetical protein